MPSIRRKRRSIEFREGLSDRHHSSDLITFIEESEVDTHEINDALPAATGWFANRQASQYLRV